MIARNQAIRVFDGVFPWVAQSLEGLFRLAGEVELADRIRTSTRRVTRRQAVEAAEGVSAGDEDPPAEAARPGAHIGAPLHRTT